MFAPTLCFYYLYVPFSLACLIAESITTFTQILSCSIAYPLVIHLIGCILSTKMIWYVLSILHLITQHDRYSEIMFFARYRIYDDDIISDGSTAGSTVSTRALDAQDANSYAINSDNRNEVNADKPRLTNESCSKEQLLPRYRLSVKYYCTKYSY